MVCVCGGVHVVCVCGHVVCVCGHVVCVGGACGVCVWEGGVGVYVHGKVFMY